MNTETLKSRLVLIHTKAIEIVRYTSEKVIDLIDICVLKLINLIP